MLHSEKKFIDKVLESGRGLSVEVVGHRPSVLVRALRKRLRMNQRQLAKRVGVPQSYIAKIESGAKKPTLETMEKVLRGLYCSYAIILIPEVDLDDVIQKRAHLTAQKRVKHIAGTMALEEQLPKENALKEMIEEETARLLDSHTTKIWD